MSTNENKANQGARRWLITAVRNQQFAKHLNKLVIKNGDRSCWQGRCDQEKTSILFANPPRIHHRHHGAELP